MPKKLDILDSKGAVNGSYAIEDSCLEMEKGTQAVHDVVVAFLAEQRAGTACTKTRGERRGGGAKPFKQKGLGRARSGSSRNPLWTGGGVIFGPKPRSFSKKVNKKVRTLALRRAFSEVLNDGKVMVIDKFELADSKTKSAKAIFDALKIDDTVMLVVKDYEQNIDLATRNLAHVLTIRAASVNVYQLLYFDKIIFTQEALDEFVQRLA
jgi:large subunit ribosomal protein L4